MLVKSPLVGPCPTRAIASAGVPLRLRGEGLSRGPTRNLAFNQGESAEGLPTRHLHARQNRQIEGNRHDADRVHSSIGRRMRQPVAR